MRIEPWLRRWRSPSFRGSLRSLSEARETLRSWRAFDCPRGSIRSDDPVENNFSFEPAGQVEPHPGIAVALTPIVIALARLVVRWPLGRWLPSERDPVHVDVARIAVAFPRVIPSRIVVAKHAVHLSAGVAVVGRCCQVLRRLGAFDGEDTTEMIAAVMKTPPDWSAPPADVPAQIVTLIQRCLEKDRKKRVADISTARFLIDEPMIVAPTARAALAPVTLPRTPLWRRAIPFVVTALLAGALVGGVASNPRPPSAALTITRFTVTLSELDAFRLSIP